MEADSLPLNRGESQLRVGYLEESVCRLWEARRFVRGCRLGISGSLLSYAREGGRGDDICVGAADELPDETLARGGATVLLEVPWTYVDARFPTPASMRPAVIDPPFELQNRFGLLEVEDAEGAEDAPVAAPDVDDERPPGRLTGRDIPRRGPRTPREVRDLESYLMRPVPMRRRSGNEQVLGAHARFLQHWFRRTRALAAARAGRTPTAPPAWSRGGMRGLLPIYRPVHRPRCTDGIASEAVFAEQRRRARRVLMCTGSMPNCCGSFRVDSPSW